MFFNYYINFEKIQFEKLKENYTNYRFRIIDDFPELSKEITNFLLENY